MKLEDFSSTYNVISQDNNLNYRIAGLPRTPDFYPHKNQFKVYIIPSENAFRPDKIANDLLQDSSLDWVLDLINFFTSEKEYYVKRAINYLEPDILHSMGII